MSTSSWTKSAPTSVPAFVPAPPSVSERLVSLDVLRGIDIFLLFLVDYLFPPLREPLSQLFSGEGFEAFARQFNHVPWEGFVLCDLIMPLFLFLCGATIPFSLARYLRPGAKHPAALWIRIVRRVVVLWILGAAVQGNLPTLDPSRFKIFSNTLQAIAVGYLISCVVYLSLPKKTQYGVFGALILLFWAALAWGKFGEYGGGSYSPNGNLAYGIDATVFGRFRDGVQFGENGEAILLTGYQYTWILSSLTFGATTLAGMFAGELLRSTREKIAEANDATNAADTEKSDSNSKRGFERRLRWRAFALLFGWGLASLIAGLLWGAIPEGTFGYCPIVKKIWSPSMTLYAAGLSLLLLSACYLIFDLWRLKIGKTFFGVLGANAIVAYVGSHLLHFNEIAGWILYGLEQYVGDWYPAVLAFAGCGILWFLLWTLRQSGKFIRI